MGTMAKKIEILLIEAGMEKQELAARLGTTPSNLSGKLKRDNLSESDLHKIAKACGAGYEASFILKDGRKI